MIRCICVRMKAVFSCKIGRRRSCFKLLEDCDDLGLAESTFLQERISLLGSTPGNSQSPLARLKPYTSAGIDRIASLQLAFDSSGNLYVANVGNVRHGPYNVTVSAPVSKSVLRTISQGVYRPIALAFDRFFRDNLYVANLKSDTGGDNVTVYATGVTSPLRTIYKGLSIPRDLAFDGSGNLYVSNCGDDYCPHGTGNGYVTVYAQAARRCCGRSPRA
jgi:hypothetical protein